MEKSEILPKEYNQFIEQIKQRIRSSQIKAAVKVNEELIELYWELGKQITDRQEKEGWGSQFIEKLSVDLQKAFPGSSGFSRANLFKMKAFYGAYQKVSQVVRQIKDLPFFKIPWGHNVILLTKIKEESERMWYAEQTIVHGWSRNALESAIESDFHDRKGKAITNFSDRLPDLQSRLAQEMLKDPYNFQFLSLSNEYIERELEKGLIDHIQEFLLELGQGFAFIGRQYHFELSGKDYYIDLLFYHFVLRCFVIIDLKNSEFKPEFAGKMNFYLSAIDDKLKQPTDNPSIGMVLCKTKDRFTVEYALRDINKPMGVAGYEVKIMESLPQDLLGSLPSLQEFHAGLCKEE